METETAGEWLEAELNELCGKVDSGLQLDADLISGLVSFCELAPPLDAADYLTNIIGTDVGHQVIQGYLEKRGHLMANPSSANAQSNKNNKLSSSSEASSSTKKSPSTKATHKAAQPPATKDPTNQAGVQSTSSKKKKGNKSMSLAEASKKSVVFHQGQPCSCQARKHELVSNCLSCGKIVCSQEGEGPCSFCGSLVLKEGSSYAGLTDSDLTAPLSKEEEMAEEFAKRLVDYDRNSAARTKVIDDQSDYYELHSNKWLSNQEKETLQKKQEAEEEIEAKKKKNVVITFDLVGRKVVVNKDEVSELESDLSILRAPEEKDVHRVKQNPRAEFQPVFVQTGNVKKPAKGKENKNRKGSKGLCLEETGRVLHEENRQLKYLTGSNGGFGEAREGDDFDCSHDFD